MRSANRGWRSARAFPRPGAAAGTTPAPADRPATAAIVSRAWARPRVGFTLIALTFYLWIVHSYKLPLGDVAVAALLASIVMRGNRLELPAPLAIFGLLAVWSATGLFVTENPAVTWKWVMDLVKLGVVFFCIVNVTRSAGELRLVTIAWLAIFALYPVRGAYYNQYICGCTEFGRVAWNFVFNNPNDLAALSFLPLGLSAALAIVERAKLWRYLAFAGTAVLSLMVFLTQSRGALLAIIASAIAIPLSSRRRTRDLAIVAALGAIVAIAAPKSVWDRLGGLANVSVEGGMKDVDPEGSAEARWKTWQIAGRVIASAPFTGVGVGMYPIHHARLARDANEQYTVRGARDAHSTYLRIAAETGYPGLAIFLSIWGAAFWYVRKVRRKLKPLRPREHRALFFLELSMLAYLLASVFGTYGMFVYTYLHIGMVWLFARVLSQEPWYVPPELAMRSAAAVPPSPRRGALR